MAFHGAESTSGEKSARINGHFGKSTMRVEEIEFINNKGRLLSGRLYHPARAGSDGVLFCHGLFSSKDAHKIIRMSDSVAAAGFTLMTFDFSFTMGGDFSRFSILQEVEDLRSAFGYFLGRGIKAVHLVGSSMGGVVSLLFASEAHQSIKSLSLIATPVKLDELLIRLTGGTDPRTLSAEGMSLVEGTAVHNAFFHEALSIPMLERLRAVKAPALILHGAVDPIVDISNVRTLESTLRSEKRTVIIIDGEHNLTRESDIEILKENIIRWIKEHSS